MDGKANLLSDSQKDLLKNFNSDLQGSNEQLGPAGSPNRLAPGDTNEIEDDKDTPPGQLSPISLRKALENSVGTRLSNTPELSSREKPV
jgi:hypothetical protein